MGGMDGIYIQSDDTLTFAIGERRFGFTQHDTCDGATRQVQHSQTLLEAGPFGEFPVPVSPVGGICILLAVPVALYCGARCISGRRKKTP
jgi:hypothetical protein